MPYADESSFVKMRLPKGLNRYTQLTKYAQKQGKRMTEVLAEAVDKWIEDQKSQEN